MILKKKYIIEKSDYYNYLQKQPAIKVHALMCRKSSLVVLIGNFQPLKELQRNVFAFTLLNLKKRCNALQIFFDFQVSILFLTVVTHKKDDGLVFYDDFSIKVSIFFEILQYNFPANIYQQQL